MTDSATFTLESTTGYVGGMQYSQGQLLEMKRNCFFCGGVDVVPRHDTGEARPVLSEPNPRSMDISSIEKVSGNLHEYHATGSAFLIALGLTSFITLPFSPSSLPVGSLTIMKIQDSTML
eukprot:CAMPEP_0184686462 /NCGR_PEP_ID=MMETSP0312-20130426/22587_1 /TAXON_ID=31354 /ORGANISM="Compsopogon coeruleus, Strain SAG 36.94" /LENGTH=119 /DNA_ID=CAMNT_0027141579 /DNA_START=49 /DNA_END=408 /DNA_ORIENTATION=-